MSSEVKKEPAGKAAQQAEQQGNGPALDPEVFAPVPRQTLMSELFGDMALTQLHNFSGNEVEQWQKIAIAENDSTPGGSLKPDETFRVVNFYAHKVRLIDPRDGEVREPTRVVLMDQDQRCIHFVSDGVVKSLARLIQTFGFGPWVDGIPVNVKEIRTRSGFRTFALVPVTQLR